MFKVLAGSNHINLIKRPRKVGFFYKAISIAEQIAKTIIRILMLGVIKFCSSRLQTQIIAGPWQCCMKPYFMVCIDINED